MSPESTWHLYLHVNTITVTSMACQVNYAGHLSFLFPVVYGVKTPPTTCINFPIQMNGGLFEKATYIVAQFISLCHAYFTTRHFHIM